MALVELPECSHGLLLAPAAQSRVTPRLDRTVTRAMATDRPPTPAIPAIQEADRRPDVPRVPLRRAPGTASSSARGPPRSLGRCDPGWSTGDGRSGHIGSHDPPARTQGDRTHPRTPPTSGSRTSRHETSIRNPGPRWFRASAPPEQARAAALPAHRASRPPPPRRTVESSTHLASAAVHCAPWLAAGPSWSFRPLAGRPSRTTWSHPDHSGKPSGRQLLSLPRSPGPRRGPGSVVASATVAHAAQVLSPVDHDVVGTGGPTPCNSTDHGLSQRRIEATVTVP